MVLSKVVINKINFKFKLNWFLDINLEPEAEGLFKNFQKSCFSALERFLLFLLFPSTFRIQGNLLFFLYSRDFVISPVSRHFLTGVGCGPLRAEQGLIMLPVKTLSSPTSHLGQVGRRPAWALCVQSSRVSLGRLPLKIWCRLVGKMWILYSGDKALRHDLALALSCGRHNERDQGKASAERNI